MSILRDSAPPRQPAFESIAIVDFDAVRHGDAFRALNVAWITTYFELEAADLKVLDDPVTSIIRPGGRILMAETEADVVGTCALIPITPGEFELAKMAVTPAARGNGVGELMGRAAIERASQAGAHRVELLSNTALVPAIQLYRKLGFVEVPLGTSDYRRGNIRMALELGAGRQPSQA
jgi:GNAT superfamily N-acetyltransferase